MAALLWAASGCGDSGCPKGYEQVGQSCVPAAMTTDGSDAVNNLGSCDANRGDCDGDSSNGCEVELTTDRNHCGGCDMKCGWGPCVAGQCDDPLQLAVATQSVGHSCVTLRSGRVACWGENARGALGNGRVDPISPAPAPSYVRLSDGSPLGDVASVAVSHDAGCVRLRTGRVLCWGIGDVLNTSVPITNPQPMLRYGTYGQREPIVDVRFLAMGLQEHACMQRNGASLDCWGRNDSAKTGVGPSSTPISMPSPVSDGGITAVSNGSVTAVALGNGHSCALLPEGRIACWGLPTGGQLGIGPVSPQLQQVTQPVLVKGVGNIGNFAGALEITAGGFHSCARTAQGVFCWGYNAEGTLGTGIKTPAEPSPVQVKGVDGNGNLGDVVQLAAGWAHTCALLSNHRAVCWGGNWGRQLGSSTDSDLQQATPAYVKNADGSAAREDLASIACGGVHCCAITLGNDIVCWGRNEAGQLGDGTTTNQAFPVPVRPLTEAL